MKRIEEPSLCVSKRYFSENKTRSEKAANFMQYVLYNENVLEEFKKVFSYRSQVELTPHTCKTCATGNTQQFVIRSIHYSPSKYMFFTSYMNFPECQNIVYFFYFSFNWSSRHLNNTLIKTVTALCILFGISLFISLIPIVQFNLDFAVFTCRLYYNSDHSPP